MRVGICLPQFRDDAEAAVATARAAEEADLDGVFAFDHLWPLGRPDRPAPYSGVLRGAPAAAVPPPAGEARCWWAGRPPRRRPSSLVTVTVPASSTAPWPTWPGTSAPWPKPERRGPCALPSTWAATPAPSNMSPRRLPRPGSLAPRS